MVSSKGKVKSSNFICGSEVIITEKLRNKLVKSGLDFKVTNTGKFTNYKQCEKGISEDKELKGRRTEFE